MPITIGLGTPALTRALTAFILGLIAQHATAQTIQGTAAYRERMAMPAGAVFEATLEDVSRADAPALVIASTRLASPGNPPIKFSLDYEPGKIVADNRYVVRARITQDGKLLFTSDTATPVITRGSPTSVSIMLRRAAGSQAVSPNPGGKRPLQGTYWKATELAGKPTPTQDANREAHVVFQTADRVSGSDGCNRFTGSYKLVGDTVTFGQMAGTRMACINTSAEVERAFREALKSATRLMVVNERLDLFDTAGNRVAVFTAGAQASGPATSPALAGTSWQLVKFQGSDEKTLTPDDGAKYTIEFGSGRLTARIDCNRGPGTWKSSRPNQLEFGPVALTRAKCPGQSMHDQIVKQWANIRSYVVKDGHLFLSLMADGGIYEFEPIKKSNR